MCRQALQLLVTLAIFGVVIWIAVYQSQGQTEAQKSQQVGSEEEVTVEATVNVNTDDGEKVRS